MLKKELLVTESHGLTSEGVAERAVPWASIEFVQILDEGVDYDAKVIWSDSWKYCSGRQKQYIHHRTTRSRGVVFPDLKSVDELLLLFCYSASNELPK